MTRKTVFLPTSAMFISQHANFLERLSIYFDTFHESVKITIPAEIAAEVGARMLMSSKSFSRRLSAPRFLPFYGA